MCTKNQLEVILREVSRCAKDLFGNKLDSIILYGSYARGDYDGESDIDIMILADIPVESCHSYSMNIGRALTDTELDNDVVISPNVVSLSVFEKYKTASPFYNSVTKEGIRIAV